MSTCFGRYHIQRSRERNEVRKGTCDISIWMCAFILDAEKTLEMMRVKETGHEAHRPGVKLLLPFSSLINIPNAVRQSFQYLLRISSLGIRHDSKTLNMAHVAAPSSPNRTEPRAQYVATSPVLCNTRSDATLLRGSALHSLASDTARYVVDGNGSDTRRPDSKLGI
jgi:hypothetical protein